MNVAAEKARRRFAQMWDERTKCANGHDLEQTELLVQVKRGCLSRQCRECIRDQRQRHWERLKQDPERLTHHRERVRRAAAAYRARQKDNS